MKLDNLNRTLVTDGILEKLRELKSGVYFCVNGELKDMVYEVPGEYFLNWIDEYSGICITKETRDPVKIIDKYNILKLAEKCGFVFGRIPEEWDEFEKRMEKLID